MDNLKNQLTLQKVENKSEAAIRLYNTIQQRLVAEEVDLVYFLESARRFPMGSLEEIDQNTRANQLRQMIIGDTYLLEIIAKKIQYYQIVENPVPKA